MVLIMVENRTVLCECDLRGLCWIFNIFERWAEKSEDYFWVKSSVTKFFSLKPFRYYNAIDGVE